MDEPGRIARMILVAGLVVEALCYIGLGAGLALILSALHAAGVTP